MKAYFAPYRFALPISTGSGGNGYTKSVTIPDMNLEMHVDGDGSIKFIRGDTVMKNLDLYRNAGGLVTEFELTDSDAKTISNLAETHEQIKTVMEKL